MDRIYNEEWILIPNKWDSFYINWKIGTVVEIMSDLRCMVNILDRTIAIEYKPLWNQIDKDHKFFKRWEERIIASAYNIDWCIVVWKRHNDCLKSMEWSWLRKPQYLPDESGFYTSEFRYVDRKEWMLVAKAAGQLLDRAPTWGANTLYSEDVW